MARKPLAKSNPVGDVEAKINADFNQLIKKIHKQLSTKKKKSSLYRFFCKQLESANYGC